MRERLVTLLAVLLLFCLAPQPAYATGEGIGFLVGGILLVLLLVAIIFALVLRGAFRIVAKKGGKPSRIARMELPVLVIAVICIPIALINGVPLVTGFISDITSFQETRQAAERGDSSAQLRLALDYSAGKGTFRDENAAMEWCRKSAENGNDGAMKWLADMLAAKGKTEEAIKWYRLSSEKGDDKTSQFTLAEIYFNGNGVPKNHPEALKFYLMAAEDKSGYATYGKDSLIRIAAIYHQGLGVPKDNATAYLYLSRAIRGQLPRTYFSEDIIKQRDTLAKDMTPEEIAHGKKVLEDETRDTVDPASATDFYNAAYDYQFGTYDKRADLLKAWENYRLAAERGHAAAMTALGMHYRDESVGHMPDYAQAYYWLSLSLARRKSAGEGDAAAKDLDWFVNSARSFLTPEKIAEIDAEVAAWKPKAD